MIGRAELERREAEQLAGYAAKAAESRGRAHPEAEHAYRTAFQRDRDRVIHCTAFRRLEYKTQVFVNHEGDHYRTRLTHSMECAQIARTIARALALNEDLAEVLALSHDMGHTPFGHSGQDALNECMKQHGGFEHNLQSLRLVTLLERRYPSFPGLNLCWEARESIRKHTVRPERPVEAEYEPAWAPLLEAQLVDIADSIAYDAHDLDDGLSAGLIVEEQVRAAVPLYDQALGRLPGGWPDGDADVRRKAAVRAIIDLEASDLIASTESNLARLGVRSTADVRAARERIVAFSAGMAGAKRTLQRFLHENLYRHHRVVVMSEKAKRFIRALFDAYVSDPQQLPPRWRAWASEAGLHRAVADYVAGMTDRYAQDEYRKLFHPFENIL